jgi:hypothetical protein
MHRGGAGSLDSRQEYNFSKSGGELKGTFAFSSSEYFLQEDICA